VRTRNAMGNLAHELKRPLQLLSIQQEGGRNADMRNTLDDIRNILERELRRARISGSSGVGGAFDPAQEAGAMADVLRKIYPDIDLEVELESRFETTALDRDDMLELIGNLLDNACKFARSRARLTIGRVDGQLEFVIEDDGPGLEPDQLQQLNRRGRRLDENVAGHGLGLGISRDILDYYRGALDFARSELGGLRVTVQIPLP
jgi:signal transduction histidine kinase